MRFAIACALSLLLGLAALPIGADTASAEWTLDRLLASMSTSSGLSASFTEEKRIALLSQPLESHGQIYFVPPDRFARFTDTPSVTALVIDGDQVTFHEDARGDSLDLSDNPMTRAFVENFVALWSGDRARLERLYRAAVRGDAEHWELRLEPRGAPMDRFIQAITLLGRAATLTTMRVSEPDGDLTTTHFDAVRSDRAFSADEMKRIFVQGLPLAAPHEQP
jgi:outer membrane lipoprotein-sorting protein